MSSVERVKEEEYFILPHLVSSLDAYIDSVAGSRANKIISKTTTHLGSNTLSPVAPGARSKRASPRAKKVTTVDANERVSSPEPLSEPHDIMLETKREITPTTKQVLIVSRCFKTLM